MNSKTSPSKGLNVLENRFKRCLESKKTSIKVLILWTKNLFKAFSKSLLWVCSSLTKNQNQCFEFQKNKMGYNLFQTSLSLFQNPKVVTFLWDLQNKRFRTKFLKKGLPKLFIWVQTPKWDTTYFRHFCVDFKILRL